MVINILNTCIICLIYTGLRNIFSYLDFRGVLIWVISNSYRVASILIIKTTSRVKPILIEKVVKVVVAVVIEIV
jgi:hypothetical protein